MTLRARSAAWFEIVVARDWLARTLQTVAATGSVELEACRSHELAADVVEVRHRLAQCGEQLDRHRDFQPPPRFRELEPQVDLGQVLEQALDRIGAWSDAAEPLVAAVRSAERRRGERAELVRALEGAMDAGVDLSALEDIGPEAFCDLYRFDPGGAPESWPQDAIVRSFDGIEGSYCLLVASADRRDELEGALSRSQGRRIDWPPEMAGRGGGLLDAGRDLLWTADGEVRATRARLDRLTRSCGVAEALGDVIRLRWLARYLGDVPVGDYLATLTGWTDDLTLERLPAVLESAGIPALVHLLEPPADRVAPTLMNNPRWVRPFELFARQLGTPGTREADPSELLAVIVPVLFGFMFGDVGQGLVLLALGLWLKRRWPAAGILVPAGACAMVFGFLYGSIFAVEGLLPALWTLPLDSPLVMLVVPLVGGALLMALGLLLGGLHAVWLGAGRPWLRRDAALLLVPVALAGLALTSRAVLLLPLAWIWYAVGSSRGHPAAWLAGAGSFLEKALQLAINTLSFVRVGAFALAHAGLGSAVTSVVEGVESALVMVGVLVIGNVVIIALEGLVVSIQTTRLILFEFFVRFFTAEGRPFRPMVLPR